MCKRIVEQCFTCRDVLLTHFEPCVHDTKSCPPLPKEHKITETILLISEITPNNAQPIPHSWSHPTNLNFALCPKSKCRDVKAQKSPAWKRRKFGHICAQVLPWKSPVRGKMEERMGVIACSVGILFFLFQSHCDHITYPRQMRGISVKLWTTYSLQHSVASVLVAAYFSGQCGRVIIQGNFNNYQMLVETTSTPR